MVRYKIPAFAGMTLEVGGDDLNIVTQTPLYTAPYFTERLDICAQLVEGNFFDFSSCAFTTLNLVSSFLRFPASSVVSRLAW